MDTGANVRMSFPTYMALVGNLCNASVGLSFGVKMLPRMPPPCNIWYLKKATVFSVLSELATLYLVGEFEETGTYAIPMGLILYRSAGYKCSQSFMVWKVCVCVCRRNTLYEHVCV